MPSKVTEEVIFTNTIGRLEQLRRCTEGGIEYWYAREIKKTLGYSRWGNFENVMERARRSMDTNGVSPSHHFAETETMMEIGKGASRKNRDFFLSRAACYLIAMNGDPSKPEIAAAQAYFAIQTRAREIETATIEDEKRLELREKIKESFKVVSGAAKQAGVTNAKQPIFHDARYRGLYRMSSRDMKSRKGIKPRDNPFDRMGALELSANDFQMNLATETIEKENIKGESNAIKKNREVAEKVRQTMIDSGSRPPEDLPAAEPIGNVAKRLKKKNKISKGLGH